MRSPIAGSLVLLLATGMAHDCPAATPDINAIVKGNNQFALELYGQLRGEEGNLFLSPQSISFGLAMTYAGARGETATEIAETMHVTLPPRRLHPAFSALERELRKTDAAESVELNVANSLWGQRGYGFLPEFLAETRAHYGAGFHEVDFSDEEEAGRAIDAWVAKETRGKIETLRGVASPITRLVLANAIYFKGLWKDRFDPRWTREEPFHVSPVRSVAAAMMSQTESFPYYANESSQLLELPYEGEDLSMVVLLPKEVDGLRALEQTLTAEFLEAWLKAARSQEVHAELPKFKFTAEFKLNQALAELGMPLAFSAGADFSGMSGKGDLFLSTVIHKAFVEVNEEGTEAAAATGHGTATEVLEVPIFRADHPFVFLIRHVSTGTILFMGRITDPTR